MPTGCLRCGTVIFLNWKIRVYRQDGTEILIHSLTTDFFETFVEKVLNGALNFRLEDV